MRPYSFYNEVGTGSGFNPHPPRRADETRATARVILGIGVVSIRIRPGGRMRRYPGQDGSSAQYGFNPHPPRRADETIS